MDEHRFVGLLEDLLQPDTERIKRATATLSKTYYASPDALVALLDIVAGHPRPPLRQLAAIEARKLAAKHWSSLPPNEKTTRRNQLLQAALNEPVPLTRHAVARLIASVAPLDFADGDWHDLPHYLLQAATSPTPGHREVAIYILFTLIEGIFDPAILPLSDICTLFTVSIQDPESAEVRSNTMQALGSLALRAEALMERKVIDLFQSILPNMVAVLKSAVDEGDEEHAMLAFDTFQNLLASDPALLHKHFVDLIKFMVELSADSNIEDEHRCQALSFLIQCVRLRKLKVQGLRVAEEITLKALHIVTELEDLSADDDDPSPAKSALGLLDVLASNLPPSQVVVPLLKSLGPYFGSTNPNHRQAAILALGMCVEGAPDFISTQLGEILPMVLHLLSDPQPKVRVAALQGVARLGDELAEDLGKQHARLMPAMLTNFDLSFDLWQVAPDDEHLRVLRGSCYAIDSLIEGLDTDDAAPYAAEFMVRFSKLVSLSDEKTKGAAASAIGSIAAAADKSFLPYFEETMRNLGPYVSLTGEGSALELRGAVCDSMGKIAVAVGPAPFAPYVDDLMKASEEALHLNDPRLRETSYILWSTMSRVYEEDFAKYLPGAVKGLQDCLEQEETDFQLTLSEAANDLLGTDVNIAGRKFRVSEASNTDGDVDVTQGNEDAGDDGEWSDIDGVTAVAMEKEVATDCFGDIVSNTKRQYLPHLEKTVTQLLGITNHSFEGVRKGAISALWRSYATLWQLAEDDGLPKWKPGLPLQIQPTADLAKLGSLVMKATLEVWESESDRATVTQINRDLGAVLKTCGPAMLVTENGSAIQPIAQQLVSLITKSHPCQEDAVDDVADEVLEESSEYDWLVIETALDTVTCLSTALGPSFGELWTLFEKAVMKHASSSDSTERASAVGTVAECAGNMGAACTPYTPTLLKLLLHRLSDEDWTTRSNAIYGIGLLYEATQDATAPQSYPTTLSKLEPLLDLGDDPSKARLLDNAAGCISRMVSAHPDKLPLPEVLPRLMQLLPVREDYGENKPVFKTVVQLYQANEPTMLQLTPGLMAVLPKVLGPPEDQIDEELRSQLVELVQYLQQQK